MKSLKIFIIVILFNNFANAKICKPKIIKNESEIQEKLKICDKGDKILVLHDIKVRSDELILKLCDLKYTIIQKEDSGVIHKRNSGLSIICVFNPSF
tara:strand:+ start:687 stop:977 length:291 start_codon:yes stop_codon:yes gene_type:complete